MRIKVIVCDNKWQETKKALFRLLQKFATLLYSTAFFALNSKGIHFFAFTSNQQEILSVFLCTEIRKKNLLLQT